MQNNETNNTGEKIISHLSREEEVLLIEEAKTNPEKMAELIVLLKNVIGVAANEFNKSGIDVRDLYQQGVLGIHRAVHDFDPSKGYRFSTYSRWWVWFNMQKYYLRNSRAFAIPLSESQKLNQIMQHTNPAEFNDLGAQRLIAEKCGMSLDKYLITMRCVCRPEPIDYTDSDEHSSYQYADNEKDAPSISCLRKDDIERVKYAVDCLPDIQKRILSLRFGLGDSDEKTLQETGVCVNLSYERVRQLEKQALATLRRIVEA